MKFINTYLSKEHRYWLGTESDSGSHFAAIPVSNQMVDYIESYRITPAEYEAFLHDEAAALEFVESCRRREQDDRLFMPPGADRGTPT
ncbi:hypothetical protein [Mycobacterium camsae]|uniref:hypothetical protein n=1 Tax=Mycobacterium gordonae TaxID=1778 RepID=UPI00197F3084|nr:hypothetical protein [Mycobacterium gordonae]